MNTITTPLTRTRRDDAASFTATLHSEWIKFSTIRSNRIILGLSAVAGIVLSWIIAALVKTDPNTGEVFTIANTFVFSTWLSSVMSAIAGSLMFTSEVAYGTLAGSITSQPARWVTATAKATIAGGFGLAMAVVAMTTGYAGAALGGLHLGDSSTMPTLVVSGLLVASLSAMLGLGVGMIIRHSSAAVSTLLVWAFVIENLIRGLAPARIVRFLPFSAADGLLGIRSAGDSDQTVALAFHRPANALMFFAYSIGAVIVGTVLLYRRDN